MTQAPHISSDLKNSDDKQIAAQADLTLDLSKPTSGEKKYAWLKFGVAEVFIVASTAALAYVARYGKESYGPVRNYLKDFETWFEKLLKTNDRKTDAGKVIAGAAASTMVTMHGGNFFAPVMMWFENNKEKIVTHFNKRSGDPQEVEAGKQRLKNEPKQGWASIITGRIISFSIVWTAFVGGTILAGKNKGVFNFHRFEDYVGTKFAALTKEGNAISKLSVAERLENHAATNNAYKFGRILALDIFATTVAISVWNTVSAIFSAKNHKEPNPVLHKHALTTQDTVVMSTDNDASPNFTARIKPHAMDGFGGYAQKLATESPSLLQTGI